MYDRWYVLMVQNLLTAQSLYNISSPESQVLAEPLLYNDLQIPLHKVYFPTSLRTLQLQLC